MCYRFCLRIVSYVQVYTGGSKRELVLQEDFDFDNYAVFH